MSDTNNTTPVAEAPKPAPLAAPAPAAKLNLTPIQALDILIQAVHLAQQKGGVYTLKEASLLFEAVEVFAQQQQAAQAQNTPQPPAPAAN
jgi:hypothetical protein